MNPGSPPRFFLAHAKSCDDQELERLVSALSGLLDRFANGKPYDLILGRAYFEARFKAAGSWDSWAMEVAQGIDPVTREGLFKAIFVPVAGEAIGAGTARIVDFALKGSRRVIAFDLEGRSARVTGLRRVQGGTWQNGWSLVVDRNLI